MRRDTLACGAALNVLAYDDYGSKASPRQVRRQTPSGASSRSTSPGKSLRTPVPPGGLADLWRGDAGHDRDRTKSSFGRYDYAVGGSPESAELAGVSDLGLLLKLRQGVAQSGSLVCR